MILNFRKRPAVSLSESNEARNTVIAQELPPKERFVADLAWCRLKLPAFKELEDRSRKAGNLR